MIVNRFIPGGPCLTKKALAKTRKEFGVTPLEVLSGFLEFCYCSVDGELYGPFAIIGRHFRLHGSASCRGLSELDFFW